MPPTPPPAPDVPPAATALQPPPAPAPARPPAADWQAVRQLFDALAPCGPDERAQRLADLARHGTAAAVLAEVQALLAHADGAEGDGFLARPAAPAADRDTLGASTQPLGPHEAAGPDRAGQRLGAWQLRGLLGRGGMGEVWAAERADGAYQAQAAVKVLKRGMDSQQVLARFAQEQHTLARLQHPHIAHLLDAGRTADGLPYFVMEAVDGQPIDQACRGRPLAQRLALFLQLTDAVAHAHRQLLVHRDLKPGNVLVDRQGQVKLLDFGIAKALDPLEGQDGGGTLFGERPFTPHYASPEQVRGEPVGTATDVYSLGVLLYVLLTGQRPYGLQATHAAEAARAVLDDAPTRPSALPAGANDDPQWPALRRRLAGDLDNILLKALDKRPTQRYASVDALAADLRAHLAGFPVSAQPPSWAYGARKFIGRHRLPVALAAVAVLALVGALATTVWHQRQTDAARRLAERRFDQVRQLAGRMVFRYHDQIAQLPGAIATREALLQDAVRYLDGLAAEGPLQPALARELAETYFRVATLQGEQFSPSQERLADAARNLDKALALQPHYLPPPDLPPQAQATAAHQAVLRPPPRAVPPPPLEALNLAADMWLARAGQAARAARLADSQRALAAAHTLVTRAQARQPDDPQTLSRLATLEGRLALALGGSAAGANLGQVTEALAHHRRALALFERLRDQAPDNPEWAHQLAWGCQNLATTLVLAGRADQALPWSQRTLALRREVAARQPGHSHHQYQPAPALAQLAVVWSTLGQHAQARQALDAAEALMRQAVRNDGANKAALRDLGYIPLLRGRLAVQAGQPALARAALQVFVAQHPVAGPPPAPAPSAAPAASSAASGPAPAAATAPDATLDFYAQRIAADGHLWLARAWLPDDPARALAHARRSAQAMAGDDDNAARGWALAQAQGEQAAALAALGRRDEAAAQAQAALQTWQRATPAGEPVPGLFAPHWARVQALAQGRAPAGRTAGPH